LYHSGEGGHPCTRTRPSTWSELCGYMFVPLSCDPVTSCLVGSARDKGWL
jgi:hypothetical protein